jgi:signal transduction histidine kinase
MQMRRDRIEEFDALAFRLTIVFVVVGCVASLAVLVLTLRGQHLRAMLRHRAEEETTLRALARALSGAVAVPDVASLTVNAAIQLSRVGGAYLAAAHDGRLAVLAAGGSCASKSGKSLVVPRWFNDRRQRKQPRVLTCETPGLHDHQRGRRRGEISSQLIVPMHHDGSIIGLLALRSAGGRRALSHSTARYGRALGDLAAVAMHRAQALEREREARLQAEGAVQTRDRVVSIVSHDLRNPLTAILGGAELLLDVIPHAPDRESERDQLERVKHAAITMNRLIADLLDITRLESGPLPMHSAELNLVEVIDEALDLFRSPARQREITLEWPAVGGLPTVWGDRDRLAQMLSNLLGNALKFTPRGGRVGIGVAVGKDKRGLELVVHDTGPGIPPDRLEHLFDRFWQVTNDHRGGLGLGLSIVRAIADAHGGKIHVESKPEGGTTVRIALPTKSALEQ